MPSFSVILQDPRTRAIVQENMLARAFHDALYPAMLFRGEAEPQKWSGESGDQIIDTAPGLMRPKLRPLTPGTDPTPSTWNIEQWEGVLQQYADSADISTANDYVAIISLFDRNAQQLGLGAAQTVNRLVRNKLYNAGLSGNTNTSALGTGVNTISVYSLNGLTRARNPSLVLGSPVRFNTVSNNNPLAVRIMTTTGEVTRNIISYTPTYTGDEIGPGTITIDGAPITVAARAYVVAVDATKVIRVGGGNNVDSIGATDVIKLQDIRSAIARLRNCNVPPHADGRYHVHLDPESESQLFNDAEFQRLSKGSLGEGFMYREFAIAELLGAVFFRNNECPRYDTIDGQSTVATPVYTQDDPFVGELYSTGVSTGTVIHRVVFTGNDAIREYYVDTTGLISEAGLNGKIGDFTGVLTNDGIEILADRIALLIRAPQDRMGDKVGMTWKFMGDFPVRTDSATGDAARFKRICVIEHGQ
jgi:hypothetical protein